MKVYFLSCAPCELTLNGIFYGIVDHFERFAEIDLGDRLFAKFTPQSALPVGVFLTESLLGEPPAYCEVYHLPSGVALYIKAFPPLDHTLTPITQAREGDLLVTAFRQGEIHLSIQSSEGFFISTLPPSFENCTLSFHRDLILIEGKNHLIFYTKGGKRVFSEHVLSFEVTESTLNATLPLSDSLSRTAKCKWEFTQNGLVQTQFQLQNARRSAPDECLAYAFFESILLGADYAQFLCDELRPDAEKLIDYFGPFTHVTLTDDPYTCGLVKRRSEGVFDVVHAKISVNLGKIVDILC